MPSPYTHAKLTDVKDSARESGFGELMEARFAGDDLEAEPDRGRLHPDPAEPTPALRPPPRVAPEETRAFEARPQGLELLAMGARHDDDGEAVPDWWRD